jgi:hypothetical protein
MFGPKPSAHLQQSLRRLSAELDELSGATETKSTVARTVRDQRSPVIEPRRRMRSPARALVGIAGAVAAVMVAVSTVRIVTTPQTLSIPDNDPRVPDQVYLVPSETAGLCRTYRYPGMDDANIESSFVVSREQPTIAGVVMPRADDDNSSWQIVGERFSSNGVSGYMSNLGSGTIMSGASNTLNASLFAASLDRDTLQRSLLGLDLLGQQPVAAPGSGWTVREEVPLFYTMSFSACDATSGPFDPVLVISGQDTRRAFDSAYIIDTVEQVERSDGSSLDVALGTMQGRQHVLWREGNITYTVLSSGLTQDKVWAVMSSLTPVSLEEYTKLPEERTSPSPSKQLPPAQEHAVSVNAIAVTVKTFVEDGKLAYKAGPSYHPAVQALPSEHPELSSSPGPSYSQRPAVASLPESIATATAVMPDGERIALAIVVDSRSTIRLAVWAQPSDAPRPVSVEYAAADGTVLWTQR